MRGAMVPITSLLERRLSAMQLPLAVELPAGERVGASDARVTLRLRNLSSIARIAAGQIGRIAEDHVEGRLDVDGSMRDVMEIAAEMIGATPPRPEAAPRRCGGGAISCAQPLARAPPAAHRRRADRSSTTTCPTISMRCGWTRGASIHAPTSATPA